MEKTLKRSISARKAEYKLFAKIFSFLKSLKLAVFIILCLGVVSAVGTIFEAKYDAEYAQQLVYHSPYMYAVMILLIINLTAVMVDRWPWQKRHTAFILAHIGIILTLIGAYFTQKWGIDGSLAFQIGESNRYISVRDRELGVWSSFTGEGLVKLAQADTQFLKQHPKDKKFELQVGDKTLRAVDYFHYAVRESEIKPSTRENDGPAIRFQLMNENVNLSEWLLKPAARSQESKDLGPAKVILTDQNYQYEGSNALVLKPDSSGKVKYEIYTKSKGGQTASGLMSEGDLIETGWMGLQFRLIKYLPRAREVVEYTRRDGPSKITTSALKLEFDGEELWMGVNSVLRLFSEDKMYMVSWGNKRIDLGFDMKLTKFNVGMYQGTQRAATYESEVQVPEVGPVTISMNEPLKYNGFTFYQASFEQDETGKPVASILSVNHDPGRFLKYFGSFLLVSGSIMLFYFKKFGKKSSSVAKKSSKDS